MIPKEQGLEPQIIQPVGEATPMVIPEELKNVGVTEMHTPVTLAQETATTMTNHGVPTQTEVDAVPVLTEPSKAYTFNSFAITPGPTVQTEPDPGRGWLWFGQQRYNGDATIMSDYVEIRKRELEDALKKVA